MKNKQIIFIALNLIMCFSVSGQSLLDKAKKKAENTAGKKIENVTEKKQVNNSEQRSENQTEQNTENASQKKTYNSEGITSPTHQKYLGQAVYASEKIAKINPDESKFKTTFLLGKDYIYSRIYLDKPLLSYPVYQDDTEYENLWKSSHSSVFAIAYVDGKPLFTTKNPVTSGKVYKNEDGTDVTTFQLWIYKNDEDGGNDKELIDALNKLSEGEHKLKIDVYGGIQGLRESKTPIATSEITIIKKGKITIGRSFDALEAGLKDKNIEARFLTAIQKNGKNKGWKENFSAVTIKSDGWRIIRNEVSGVILGRSMSAWAYAVWPDGHCTYQEFSFRQDYDGSNYMDNAYVSGTGSQSTCDCR